MAVPTGWRRGGRGVQTASGIARQPDGKCAVLPAGRLADVQAVGLPGPTRVGATARETAPGKTWHGSCIGAANVP
jgi:hypothetical protein